MIVERQGDAIRRHEFPRTTYRTFAAARPRRVQEGYVIGQAILDEHIGPWQVEGDRLWFGKTFYDDEGQTGVGGFGYFDSSERRFQLFAAGETADWSTSAILVQPGAIWLALAGRGDTGTATAVSLDSIGKPRPTGASNPATSGVVSHSSPAIWSPLQTTESL